MKVRNYFVGLMLALGVIGISSTASAAVQPAVSANPQASMPGSFQLAYWYHGGYGYHGGYYHRAYYGHTYGYHYRYGYRPYFHRAYYGCKRVVRCNRWGRNCIRACI